MTITGRVENGQEEKVELILSETEKNKCEKSESNNTWTLNTLPRSFKKAKITTRIKKKANLKYFHYI